MNKKTLQLLKELNTELIEIQAQKRCSIIFDNPNESELIGNENSYLKLIYCITNLLIEYNDKNNEIEDLEWFENGLISYDIKNVFDEFSDCWIVNAKILNNYRSESDKKTKN